MEQSCWNCTCSPHLFALCLRCPCSLHQFGRLLGKDTLANILENYAKANGKEVDKTHFSVVTLDSAEEVQKKKETSLAAVCDGFCHFSCLWLKRFLCACRDHQTRLVMVVDHVCRGILCSFVGQDCPTHSGSCPDATRETAGYFTDEGTSTWN